MYDYREAMKEDVNNAIDEFEEYEGETIDEMFITKQQAFDKLYDKMFVDDSVTGNASGSYTFNTWQAEENLSHNLDLLREAFEIYGETPNLESPEICDVTIRCYLLGNVLEEVLDERW